VLNGSLGSISLSGTDIQKSDGGQKEISTIVWFSRLESAWGDNLSRALDIKRDKQLRSLRYITGGCDALVNISRHQSRYLSKRIGLCPITSFVGQLDPLASRPASHSGNGVSARPE
jgi:hypothetical protein